VLILPNASQGSIHVYKPHLSVSAQHQNKTKTIKMTNLALSGLARGIDV
jgi:hypothetical protein